MPGKGGYPDTVSITIKPGHMPGLRRKVARKAARARKVKAKRNAKRRSIRTIRRQARLTVLRMVETQDADNRASLFTVGAMGGNNWDLTFQCYCLTPNTNANNGIAINQGASEGARKGNRIRTVRSSIRFAAVPVGYDATTNPTPKPFFLCWAVISAKRGHDFNDIADVIAVKNDLYDTGSGTMGSARTIMDFIRPINTEKYTVHKCGRHKLFWSEYTGTGNASMNGGMGANNDFKYSVMKKLNFTKYVPKVITYVDNSAQPTSKPVWIVFYTVYADGSAHGTLHTPCQISLFQDFKFKDL